MSLRLYIVKSSHARSLEVEDISSAMDDMVAKQLVGRPAFRYCVAIRDRQSATVVMNIAEAVKQHIGETEPGSVQELYQSRWYGDGSGRTYFRWERGPC